MLAQDYSTYTPEDHHTWSILYKRQLDAVQQFAYSRFSKGIDQLGFTAAAIPSFEALNLKLRELTGWSIYGVPGLIDNGLFFDQLYNNHFGATTWIRKPEQIDYLEQPDMFHDVFGHVPLLTDPAICGFLHEMAAIAREHLQEEDVIESIARLYWYTIEFGLIKEKGRLRIYGAGILSSIAETNYSLSEKPALLPFNVERIIQTPYIKDSFQKQYFVLSSFSDLEKGIDWLNAYLNNTIRT